MFVAFLFARVPSWRENLNTTAVQLAWKMLQREVNDREKFHKTCAEIEKQQGKSLGDFEKLREDVLNRRFDIEQSESHNLGSMCLSACSIAKELAAMNYQAFYAPQGKFFVTSDSPVWTLLPDGAGEATVGMGFGWDECRGLLSPQQEDMLPIEEGDKADGQDN